MNNTIALRLEALRDVLKKESLDAFIFPSTDPHNGEYTPLHWQGRKWISGFDGSAGTAVVTLEDAALWTDSRYFIAAERALCETEFILMKEGLEGTPSIAQWLARKLSIKRSPQVGIDGGVNSFFEVDSLIKEMRSNGGITVRTNFDPLSVIWKDRPPIPLEPIEIHPLEYAGEEAIEKIKRIREKIKEKHAEGILLSLLDDIAWTLNLRGRDVSHNPVFVSYLLITLNKVTLFVDGRKLSPLVSAYLKKQGVNIKEYSEIKKSLSSYQEYNIILDSKEVNYTLYKCVNCGIVDEPDIVAFLKAQKNQTEISGFHDAMTRDGVAMVKFLMWLEESVKKDSETELSVSQKLLEFRKEQALFKDVSFPTISAYKENAAIVHYEPNEETDKHLHPQGLLLIDSGGQYLDGTTDITRTIALGPVSREEIKAYTLVLKGHIGLSKLKFPRGASGTQIDAVARLSLWQEGYNYLHGTGHGVGSYLNVHEGPHNIRMQYRPAPLLEGMTVTDEPGLYFEGKFGVRIENTLLTVPYKETEFGKFLGFEPLTLCPIDLTPVDFSLLTKEEILWLNDYHKNVYEKLSPFLSVEENNWLKIKTSPIKEV